MCSYSSSKLDKLLQGSLFSVLIQNYLQLKISPKDVRDVHVTDSVVTYRRNGSWGTCQVIRPWLGGYVTRTFRSTHYWSSRSASQQAVWSCMVTYSEGQFLAFAVWIATGKIRHLTKGRTLSYSACPYPCLDCQTSVPYNSLVRHVGEAQYLHQFIYRPSLLVRIGSLVHQQPLISATDGMRENQTLFCHQGLRVCGGREERAEFGRADTTPTNMAHQEVQEWAVFPAVWIINNSTCPTTTGE